MARTKTSSIIKTRSQSRVGNRPGTNVRTNDDTIAPAPVPTGHTIGDRTIDVAPTPVVTTTDPAPVTDDLFAGRPKTGALKDPPPVPRDHDSDPDSNANKKPAAKPKGRPKKVAPKATRKPCKPRTDPADDLVDPMANIHVGDATGVVTAGGIARAGGNDPVLADMDYSNPEQPEDPSKKRIRGFWLLFWDHPTI